MDKAYLILLIINLFIGINGQYEDDEFGDNYDSHVSDMLHRMAEHYEETVERNAKFLLFNYYKDTHRYDTVPPPPPNNPIEEQYDFIIVGSGSAGSALANRLSENPKWKILLLEVGKKANFFTEIPAIAAAYQFTDYNWGYTMERQENMCLGIVDQRMAWPRGRALGGTSIINYMIHVRGNRKDYDRWEAMGNPGWGYRDVLPYFKKLEDSSVQHQDDEYRNRGGPVSVQDVDYRSLSVHAFIKSSIEAGHRYVDYNGKRQMGVSYVQASTRNGRRCSTEKAYLKSASDRPNLTILTESRATKLIIEGTRIVGVQYVRNRQYNIAKASKEVIVSAGTFMTPQLLMLSGIGPKDHLQELGIPLIQNLPVGQKMYDHLTFLGLTFTLNESMTLLQSEIENPKNFFDWYYNGKGPLTSLGGVEALTYIQTNVSRDTEKYPDMELIFIGGGLHTDQGLIYRKSFRVTDEVYNAIWKPIEGISAWSVFPMLVHPYSKGHLKLKSKNPYHWPKLYGNFFSDPENLDIKTFIAAIREVQRISKSPTFQKFASTQVRTPVPGCGHIQWDTDEYWECALRHVTGTLHHQVSTCKMGPQHNPEAVVDNKLKVYGLQGLRIVDCSVIPLPLTAHTNVPAIMIGEKAADLIKQEWKFQNYIDPRH